MDKMKILLLTAVITCIFGYSSASFSLPKIKIGSGRSVASLATSSSSSSPSLSLPSSSSSSSPFSLPAIRIGSKGSSSGGKSIAPFSLPAIRLGSKATIGGSFGGSSKMMMQTINKMHSYAQGTGYRSYPIAAASFPRPAFYPMPMGSMRRPIYRMPAYMPIHRMRMAPSMAMRMYMPPPPPRFGFMPPPPAARGSFASPSTMSSMSSFGSMGSGLGSGLSSLGGMDELSSMGDMSNLDSSSLEGSPDLASALGGGDGEEYKLGGETESYKMPDDDSSYPGDDSGDEKSEYSMDSGAEIQGGSMDTSKLSEGDGSMTLDDASDVKGDSPISPNENYDSNDNSPPAGYEGSLDDTSDNSDDSGYKGSSDDSSDDMMPNLPVYTTGSSKKPTLEKSSKKSSNKKSRQPKGKKLNYKAMYEMLKAYHEEKRDAANDYNSGDSANSNNNNNNNNNNEYVTMYRNQGSVVMNDQGSQQPQQNILNQQQPQSHGQMHVSQHEQGQNQQQQQQQLYQKQQQLQQQQQAISLPLPVQSSPLPNNPTQPPPPPHPSYPPPPASLAQTQPQYESPQGYEQPQYQTQYPPSQPYLGPSQAPPQQIIYQQQPPPAQTVQYQAVPQQQPPQQMDYAMRPRRVKSRPSEYEDDDDMDEYSPPKPKVRKVIYVIRKVTRKQPQPSYAEDDDEEYQGSGDDSKATGSSRRGRGGSRKKSSASNRKPVSKKPASDASVDDDAIDEDELDEYGRRVSSESKVKPLIVKVKDPFVEAAELASLVGAVSRNLPIASSSRAATFYPSDPSTAFTNAFISPAGSPVASASSTLASFASAIPAGVPLAQLQPLAFIPPPITYSSPISLAMPSLSSPLVSQVTKVSSSSSSNSPAGSHLPITVGTAEDVKALKLERRSIIPHLGEQVIENTKGLAVRAAESVESAVRSVVEGGIIGKKSNTGVPVLEAKAGVFGSIKKAITEALARNHEVSDQISRAKERRKIDEIVKVVDHVGGPHQKDALKHVEPILKLASDPALRSLGDSLSPAPSTPVDTTPVLPLTLDASAAIETASELDQLFPFKRSSDATNRPSDTNNNSNNENNQSQSLEQAKESLEASKV